MKVSKLRTQGSGGNKHGIMIICLYMPPRYQLITMKSILFVGIIAALGLAMTTAGFGINNATAQLMADNATMAGNMTGGQYDNGSREYDRCKHDRSEWQHIYIRTMKSILFRVASMGGSAALLYLAITYNR